MEPVTPGEVELCVSFSKHLGPRFTAAGLRVQFHYNQTPGIHFRCPVPEAYRAAILAGLRDGLSARFPELPASASLWILEILDHEVDSSEMAFYRAARLVIEQAYSLILLARV